MPLATFEAEKNLPLADVSECAKHVITTTHSISVLRLQRLDTDGDVVNRAMQNVEMLKDKCNFGDSDIAYIKDLVESAVEMRRASAEAEEKDERLTRRFNLDNYLDVAKDSVTNRALTLIAMAK